MEPEMATKYQRLANLPMKSKNFGFGMKVLKQRQQKRCQYFTKSNQINSNTHLKDSDRNSLKIL